jgi:hypothetical protein
MTAIDIASVQDCVFINDEQDSLINISNFSIIDPAAFHKLNDEFSILHENSQFNQSNAIISYDIFSLINRIHNNCSTSPL